VVQLICMTGMLLLTRSELCIVGFLPLVRLHRRRLTCCLTFLKRAYKESMDIQKHGGRINLPQRLHENLPKAQQQLLSSNVEKSSHAKTQQYR
jgi:hypothetical protein